MKSTKNSLFALFVTTLVFAISFLIPTLDLRSRFFEWLQWLVPIAGVIVSVSWSLLFI